MGGWLRKLAIKHRHEAHVLSQREKETNRENTLLYRHRETNRENTHIYIGTGTGTEA